MTRRNTDTAGSHQKLIKSLLAFIMAGQTGLVLAADQKTTRPFDAAGTALAIVTGKEGIGSALAHRHIILARDVAGKIDLSTAEDGSISGGQAEVSFPVTRLSVDDPADAVRITSFLSEKGVWNEASDKIEPANSAKVRDNMLDASQLDAEKYPMISGHGSLTDCKRPSVEKTQCLLDLSLTVKGKSISQNVQVVITGGKGPLTAKFTVPLAFTDFGMKPYSAMMGAIRVSDAFTLAAVIKVN